MPPRVDPREVTLEALATKAAAAGNRKAMEKAEAALAQLRAEQARAAQPAAPAPTPQPVDLPDAVARKPPSMFRQAVDSAGEFVNGIGRGLRDQLVSEVGTIGRGLGLAPDDLPPTEDDVERMGRAEAATSRAASGFTLGGSEMLVNAITPDLPRAGGRADRPSVPEQYPTHGQRLQDEHGGSAFIGDLTGAVAGGLRGAGMLVAKGLGKAAQRAAPGLAARAAAKGAKSLPLRMGAGAGQAVTENAIQNVAETGDLGAAADGAGLAAGLGGVAPAAAEGATWLARKMRLDRWIDAYRRGVEGGRYDAPEPQASAREPQGLLQEMQPPSGGPDLGGYVDGRPVRGKQAGRDASDFAVHDFARRRNTLVRESKAQTATELEPHMDTVKLSRKEMRADVLERIKANRDPITNRPKSKQIEAALKAELADIGPLTRAKRGGKRPAPGPDGKRPRAPREPVPDPSLRHLVDRQRAMKSDAGWSNPAPSDPEKAARLREGVIKDAIAKGSPRPPWHPDDILNVRARAKVRADDLELDEDSVFRTEDEVARGNAPRKGSGVDPEDLPETAIDENLSALRAAGERQAAELGANRVNMRVGKELTGSDFFGRVDDLNEPGKRYSKYLDRLARRDPEGYARIIDFVRTAKARDATRFGLRPLVPMDLPSAAAFGGVLPMVLQNLRAGGARLAVPGLVAGAPRLERLAPRMVGPLLNPVDAVEQGRIDRERKKKNAQ